MTLLSALAPSMMNSRQTLGSSPRSIKLSISACTTAAFSVAPSSSASGCLWPSPSMPRAATSTRSLLAVVTAHPRAMHGNLATMETNLPLGPAPAVADAASATIMRRAGELLRVLAKHLLDSSDSGRQTEALEGAVHILPSRLEAGHERER